MEHTVGIVSFSHIRGTSSTTPVTSSITPSTVLEDPQRERSDMAADIIFRLIVPLCAVLGNILLMLTLGCGYVGYTVVNKIIASMAFSTCVYSLQIVVFTPFSLIYHSWVFGEEVCRVRAYITSASMAASLGAMMLISFYRYVRVVHPSQYNILTMFGDHIKCILSSLWIFCLVLSLVVFYSDEVSGDIYFKHDCNLQITKTAGIAIYTVVMATFVVVPLVVMPYFHAHIFYVSIKYRRKVKPDSSSSNNQHEAAVKLMLTVAYLGFQLCFLPYLVLSLIDWADVVQIHQKVWQYSIYILYVHAVVSFVVYGILNSKFRDAYLKLLCCGCKCCKALHNEGNNTVNIHINVRHIYN